MAGKVFTFVISRVKCRRPIIAILALLFAGIFEDPRYVQFQNHKQTPRRAPRYLSGDRLDSENRSHPGFNHRLGK